MGFQFSGFFVKDISIATLDRSVDGVEIIKEINAPFKGVGISVPKFISKDPSLKELEELASAIGLKLENEWLFMVYECFGGQIDYIFGYINDSGRSVGPIQESALTKVENIYINLMADFNVNEKEALAFEPFERGYFSGSDV